MRRKKRTQQEGRQLRLPRLRIADKVRFRDGLFETDDPELIAFVERNEAYGAQILQVVIGDMH